MTRLAGCFGSGRSIRGGTVYTPGGPRVADVLVNDGVITRVEAGLESHGETIDAKGRYVLPGAVDVHVHSRDPGFPEKEDFGSLTAAAAAGGVTVVLDMPNTVPAVDSAGVLEAKAALARSKARVDFGLWGLIRSTGRLEVDDCRLAGRLSEPDGKERRASLVDVDKDLDARMPLQRHGDRRRARPRRHAGKLDALGRQLVHQRRGERLSNVSHRVES